MSNPLDMSNLPEIPSELRPALAIFIKELDGHLSYLRECLTLLGKQQGSFDDLDLSIRAENLGHRFHVMKGGAGFFKLHKIKDSAAKGEEIFRDGTAVISQGTLLAEKLEEIFKVVKEETGLLHKSFGEANQAR